MPQSAWLTKLAVDSSAGDLQYDLAIDASGRNAPSRVDAGLDLPTFTAIEEDQRGIALVWLVVAAGLVSVLALVGRQAWARDKR
jgi:hypothetical protein